MNNNRQRRGVDEVNSDGVRSTLQLLRAGSRQFGILADEIAAITAWREPTPLPYAPKSVLGVVSIQGRMLTVLDLATLTTHGDTPRDATAQHLVALRGDEQLALAVDSLDETVEVSESDLFAKGETGETLTSGVLSREDSEIYILNVKELFPTAIQGRERRRRRF